MDPSASLMSEGSLRVLFLFDISGSMEQCKESAVKIAAMASIYEKVKVSFIFFSDYDRLRNGVERVDVQDHAQLTRDLSLLHQTGGLSSCYGAACTALLAALDIVESEKDTGALIYAITNKGGRFVQSRGQKKELNNWNKGVPAHQKRLMREMGAEQAAERMWRLNVKMMVLSTSRRAYSVTGFEALKKAAGRRQALHPGVQLLILNSAKKLFKVVTRDLMHTLNPSPAFQVQSLVGARAETISGALDFLDQLGTSSDQRNSAEIMLHEIANTDSGAKCLIGGDARTNFLFFDLFGGTLVSPGAPAWVRYCMLTSFPCARTANTLVERLVDGDDNLLGVVADCDSLGAAIRNFVDDYASASPREAYQNAVARMASSREAASAQQRQRVKTMAKGLVGPTLAAAHNCRDRGEPLLFIDDSAIKNGREFLKTSLSWFSSEFPKMSSASTFEWVEKNLLLAIRAATGEDSSRANVGLADNCITHLPGSDFPDGRGSTASPLQVLSFLIDMSVSLTTAQSFNTATLAALVMRRAQSYDPVLVAAARDLLGSCDLAQLFDGQPLAHSGCVQALWLSEGVRPLLPAGVLTTLMNSLQISNFVLALKRNEQHSLGFGVARLGEVCAEGERTDCLHCERALLPEHFPAGNRRLCLYCRTTVASSANATFAALCSIFNLGAQPTPLPGVRSRSNRRTLTGPHLSERVEADPTTRQVQLLCGLCRGFYTVADLGRVPAENKKHKCPFCRAFAITQRPKLENLLAAYVRASDSGEVQDDCTHTLAVDFIGQHAKMLLPAAAVPSSPEERERLLKLLREWIAKERRWHATLQGREPQREGSVGDEWNLSRRNGYEVKQYWRDAGIRDMLSPRQVEEVLLRQTGVRARFLPDDWASGVDNLPAPHIILAGAQETGQDRRYNENEIVKIFEEGELVTSEAARVLLAQVHPDLIESGILRIAPCSVCMSSECRAGSFFH
uniref:VWFA domain-containing protein n=1 Tax=Sicyonia whispovirus TaxID=2984283 RepID=A0A9C7CEI7_9VIRU|nr:MAG: hypothetical protein [Sicyonia whispovirus]